MAHILCDFDSNDVLGLEGDVEKRFPPCSTFKIPISLMGFNDNILQDENQPVWECRDEYAQDVLRMLDFWKVPHHPALWMQNSCVWYSQIITRKMGMAGLKNYVDGFDYGNRDLSGDPGKNNGLVRAWLSGSLAISPVEQVGFLKKMLAGRLPVRAHAVEMTRKLVRAGDIGGGRTLFAKTGSGYLGPDRSQQIGWFVGWIEEGARKTLFACRCDHQGEGPGGQAARSFMLDLLGASNG